MGTRICSIRKCICNELPSIVALQWIWVGEAYDYEESKENNEVKIYHRGLDCYEVIKIEDFRKYFFRL